MEGEILIMPYTVFQVKRKEKINVPSKSGTHSITKIELEECDQYEPQKKINAQYLLKRIQFFIFLI